MLLEFLYLYLYLFMFMCKSTHNISYATQLKQQQEQHMCTNFILTNKLKYFENKKQKLKTKSITQINLAGLKIKFLG